MTDSESPLTLQASISVFSREICSLIWPLDGNVKLGKTLICLRKVQGVTCLTCCLLFPLFLVLSLHLPFHFFITSFPLFHYKFNKKNKRHGGYFTLRKYSCGSHICLNKMQILKVIDKTYEECEILS